MATNTDRGRRRHYSPRPELVRIDWPSAFKIAIASTLLGVVLWFVFVFVFGLVFAAIGGR